MYSRKLITKIYLIDIWTENFMTKPEIQPLFAPSEFWRILIVAVILICGFATRLFDLTDPPLDYAATRQLRSAMISRGKYYQFLNDVPDWQKESALKQQNVHGRLEPEIFENIIALTYRVVGGEYVWIARIFSSFFWVLGGLALYSLTREIISDDAGIVGLVYYLFVPFGLIASRTFQPDPMMTMMIITAWLMFFNWYKYPKWVWAILAGITAGAAMYIKSSAVFFLLPGMALIVLSRDRLLKTLKDIQVWVIAILAGSPVIVYHLYGLYISGKLAGQLKGRFLPQMWIDPGFYLQWKNAVSNVSGNLILLIIGLAGLIFIKKKQDQLFLIAGWIGYVLFGFGASYYISTHYYYSLPVIPLLAVSLGAIGDLIIQWLRKFKLGPVIQAGTGLLLIAGISGGYYIFSKDDYRHEPPYYQKVADFVNPENKIVALSQDYGYRLSYYGWRIVIPWRGTEDLRQSKIKDSEQDPFSERFSEFSTDYDYFIVTRMKELRRQQNLFDELYGHYPVLVEEGGFVIFDLSERIE